MHIKVLFKVFLIMVVAFLSLVACGISDKEIAAEVVVMIDELPEVITLDNKETVEAVRQAYEALNEVQKVLVNNISILESKEIIIKNLELAKPVNDIILALPDEIKVEDEEAIIAARAAYEALSETIKELITQLERLETKEKELLYAKDPDLFIIDSINEKIPVLIMDDFQLPIIDGVDWSLKDGQDTTLYDIKTGKLLRFPGKGEKIIVVASFNERIIELELNFGIIDSSKSQVYYNASHSNFPLVGGTYETQEEKAGFGGYTILVGDKQYFIGEKAYIALKGEIEGEEITIEQLRPYGEGDIAIPFNNGLLIGGTVISRNGFGVLYENTGKVSIKFNLSYTYGRNNAAFAGYGKIKFVPQEDKSYKVMAHEADSGTDGTDNGTQITLAPGEMLWCPNMWDRLGTNFFSPKPDYEVGVLGEGTIIQIFKFKLIFNEKKS